MNNLLESQCCYRKIIPVMSCLLMACFLLSSCEPLRKKFTRKKKAEKEETEMIPVLEPIDYPKSSYSVPKEYKYHFSLLKVWQTDLLTALQENTSQKRQLYILDQMVAQLEEMKKLMVEEKQKGVSQIVTSLQSIRNDLAQPTPLRNTFVIKKNIETISRQIRKDYNFETIEKSLVE